MKTILLKIEKMICLYFFLPMITIALTERGNRGGRGGVLRVLSSLTLLYFSVLFVFTYSELSSTI